jgi:short-subunit dehydrogenase
VKEISSADEIAVLVNNAGVGYFGPHEELNPQKIQSMVATNLTVPMIMSQLLLRDLKKNSGYLINISSVTADKSNTHGCAYGATKAGLSSFSHSLFDEVRKYGVKVVTIQPDMTKSNFYRNADFCEGDGSDTYVEPQEIAQTVDFILNQREGLVISDITIKPQKHQIKRK